MIKYFYQLFIIIFCLSSTCFPFKYESTAVYIRTNQQGFLPNDLKTAIIFSEVNPINTAFEIRTLRNTSVFSGDMEKSTFTYSNFKYCYTIDFSKLREPGKYFIKVGLNKSAPFEIGNGVYNRVVASLMLFFKVQRCGPTNPILHKPCHLSDITSLKNSVYSKNIDVTGGWHDAADYIKFFATTAYTTYILLFSYEFDNKKFGFDNNKNNIPDILEEARVGIDWLLRSNYQENKYITQVQDLRDHDLGLRLPENDSLQYDRVGFTGTSKNIIGMYSAVMSLASRIWAQKFHDFEFSKKLLSAAEKAYKHRNEVPNLDNSGSTNYQDVVYWGKLALGAVELYSTTKNKNYLKDAEIYADSAGSDYWWSWGNINSLADYKLAIYDKKYAGYIYNNLQVFNKNKNSSVFNEGIGFSWGTTASILGVSLQSILFKRITGSSEFDSLSVLQRDYILGRNPWNISFIYNIGTTYPKNLHSQVGHFNSGYIPGGLSAGPAPLQILKGNNIKRTNFMFNKFNTDSVKYYDDFNDFITNEPTITGNSTAVFVFGYFSSR